MKIKRLYERALLPRYSSEGASAFDVFAMEDVEWERNGDDFWTSKVHTGLAFEIPHEHGLFIFSRSGHGFKHDTTLSNSVGLLDWDYVGELMIKLICFEVMPPNIKRGNAVAQCVLLNTPRCYFMEVDELSDTERGTNGFGSTDKE